MRVRPWSTLVVLGLTAAGVVAVAPASQAADCLANPRFDVNGDGFEDLAVGMPNQSFGKAKQAGAVIVVFGGADGQFGKHGSKQFTQDNLGGGSEKGDHFGAALAVGDLNRDGCYDLAIGVPGENGSRGRVQVVFGSPSGMTGAKRQSFNQSTAGMPGTARPNDEFGSALAIQQFPTSAALWIGVPGRDVHKRGGAGAVIRMTAGPLGQKLKTKGKFYSQETSGVPGRAQDGARFGSVLSASRWSLLVGVPHMDVGKYHDSGAVYVFRQGSWSSLTQGSGTNGNESGDRFGAAVGQVASCTGGASDEAYVVGIPNENAAGVVDGGRVTVFDKPAGATLILEPGKDSLPGASEDQDNFGLRLTVSGTLLVMAMPNKDVGAVRNAGAAIQATLTCDAGAPTVAPGAADQISLAGEVYGTPHNGDRFGMALAFARSAPGEDPVLLSGAPLQADGSVNDAGRVTVFPDRATPGGLVLHSGTSGFGQSTAGIAGRAQTGDLMGAALAGHA